MSAINMIKCQTFPQCGCKEDCLQKQIKDHSRNVDNYADDCKQHRKDVFGKTDMKEVAKEIGDLHYEALTELMYELQAKILTDGANDIINKKTDTGTALLAVSDNIAGAWIAMRKVWKLCKPKMQ